MIKNEKNGLNSVILASNFVKTFFVIFVFCMSICSVFALDDAKLAERVDIAFQRQSKDLLNEILIERSGSANYAEIEAYVLKKIRESLIFDRLEYAQIVSLALIDNNLDNFGALDLYTRISATLDIRGEIEAEAEVIRLVKIEAEKKAAIEIRAELEKEFQQVVTAEGQNIYFTNPSETRYTPLDWSVSLGFIGLSVISTPSITSVRYGVAADVGFFYYGDSFAFGGEASASSYMLAFSGAENFVTDYKIIPAISFFDLSRNFFFRFGFRGIFTDPTQDGTTVSAFLSPVIGVEWKNIAIGTSKSNVFFDYLFGHFAVPEIKAAFDVGVKTAIPISNQGIFSIGALIGLSDTLMITDEGIENHARLTISIGVGNYE